jgi:hypothetical protein
MCPLSVPWRTVLCHRCWRWQSRSRTESHVTGPAVRRSSDECRDDRDRPFDAAVPTELGVGAVLKRLSAPPAGILIGYARCSTEKQDLTAQGEILRGLGVTDERIYLDHGLTGTNRSRPGLSSALAALREGDTLVVPKLDRLARSVSSRSTCCGYAPAKAW